MKKGKRITSLEQLVRAAEERRSVILPEGAWLRRYPAAYVLMRSGHFIHRAITGGMWLNIPKRPVDPNKPPRKWKTRQATPAAPAPVLALPYYPDL